MPNFPVPVIATQPTTPTVGQVTIDSSGETIGANPANRKYIQIKSSSANTQNVFLAPTTASASGWILGPGETFVDYTQAVWKGITAASTSVVSFEEVV